MKFTELKIKTEIVQALKNQNITEPTEIQEKTIPIVLEGKDLIGISKTGSGKTIAFGIPILEKIMPKQEIQALIIAPTRELAVQISKELIKLGGKKIFVTTIYGGVSINPQIENLKKAQIVVGTPGRLLDHLNRRTLNLSKIKTVVLDEADKMVEMGFIEDITRIINHTPKERQTLLFGATIAKEITHLKNRYMKNPATIKASTHVQEDYLEQYYYEIKPQEKFSLLVHLLQKQKADRIMIFCSTRATVELVTKNLNRQGIKADMIHGKLSQNKRLRTIERFHKSRNSILVASAVAARGLDIKNVTHIINYDLSQDPQEYIHRIGRTARAGEKGKAITLLSEKDHDAFREIFSRYSINIKKLETEKFPRIPFQARQMQRHQKTRFSRGPRRHISRRGEAPTPRFGGF